ncbi:MAG: hypothetical protein H6724_06035 [Sandaracinus sp.]|nr:hypothetical protein [Sandaracinus sp.]
MADRCEGFSAASAEVCNGEDDDCDGVVDDGVPSETFGAGRCATTLTCVDGAWNASAAMPAPTELCTAGSIGVDDDCDGAIDETCAAPTIASTCALAPRRKAPAPRPLLCPLWRPRSTSRPKRASPTSACSREAAWLPTHARPARIECRPSRSGAPSP